MKKVYFLVFVLTCLVNEGLAQEYHLLLFEDKDTSAFLYPEEFLSDKALQRREKQGIAITSRDYPVTKEYLQTINATGARVVYPSKWLNGALVEVTTVEQLDAIMALSFVKQSSHFSQLYGGTQINQINKKTSTLNYGNSHTQLDMIGITNFHDQGITGEGISIAIFDSGFPGVDTTPPFEELRVSGRIKGTYDFVRAEQNVYNDHRHGTQVLSTMAAIQDSALIGAAFGADYYLFVTEDVASESPVEEFNWLIAAEWADSIGVDIINSSLGYSTFDNVEYDYSFNDITGNQSIISQAAGFAAATGMLVVNSSGNAYLPWGNKLHLPSDNDSVLAVGSVNTDKTLSSFSSRGPTADGRIKPDIVAMGGQTIVAYPDGNIGVNSGTSFASPIIAGFAACVWQTFPHLSNIEIINLIRNVGDKANNPDSSSGGYGIPHYDRIIKILSLDYEVNSKNKSSVFPNPIKNGKINIHFNEKRIGQISHIQLFDSKGIKLVDQQIKINASHHQLQINPLISQFYVLLINYGNTYEAFRVMKEN